VTFNLLIKHKIVPIALLQTKVRIIQFHNILIVRILTNIQNKHANKLNLKFNGIRKSAPWALFPIDYISEETGIPNVLFEVSFLPMGKKECWQWYKN
jgi:hypothetical protein